MSVQQSLLETALSQFGPDDFVLLVEDDSTLRRILKKALERVGFRVRDAENGLIAKTVFDLNRQTIRLLITDVRMPELDGIELLKHVRETSHVPIVVMTGFSELLEAQDAYRLGATEFVTKPFHGGALVEAVRSCFDTNPKPFHPTFAGMPSSTHCPIHIDEFIASTRLVSDIYVRLGDDKYIKVAYRGDRIPVERLRVYKDKQVEFLYVSVTDFGAYVNFNFKVSEAANKQQSVSKEKKVRLLKNTSEVLVQHCFLAGVNQELVAPARQVVESTVELVTQDPDVLDMFVALQSHADRVYAHSVMVSVYSCLAARQHGWMSSITLFKLALGGLLHDIGSKEIDRAILEKKRIHLTVDEVKLIESHPIRGRDIITQLRSLPEDIATIVAQHHENPTGTGFPFHLESNDIHPLAKLVGTVDRVATLVLPIRPTDSAMAPEEAFRQIFNGSRDDIDITFLRRLMEVFRVDPEHFELHG